MNNLWTQGIVDDIRALSDSTLTDTCTLYIFNTVVKTSVLPTIRQDNRGGGIQSFNDGITNDNNTGIPNIPCRIDVDVRGLVPQKSKDNVDVQKVERYLYIPLSWCEKNSIVPRIQDQIETSAGDPLGRLVRYRVLEVDTESDGVDVEMLVEVVS